MTDYNSAQHKLPTWADEGIINMLVEIPKGSFNKYEIQKDTGFIKLDRVNMQPPYPQDYGLIPKTYDEDDDLLDAMCIVTYPTIPGCLLEGRVIGVCRFEDTGEVDDKIIVVPNDDIRFKHVKSLQDIDISLKEEIEFFWNNYKNIQFKLKGTTDKKTIVKEWGDVDMAIEIIKKAQILYTEKYPDNPYLDIK